MKISKKSRNPRKILIDKLDRIFSKYIRLRDSINGDNTCFTCGKIDKVNNLDAGHFMPRNRMATRWDERNVQPQCRMENRFHGGEQAVFGIAIDKKYGQGTSLELIAKSHTIKKYDVQELNDLINYYKNKVQEMTNGHYSL